MAWGSFAGWTTKSITLACYVSMVYKYMWTSCEPCKERYAFREGGHSLNGTVAYATTGAQSHLVFDSSAYRPGWLDYCAIILFPFSTWTDHPVYGDNGHRSDLVDCDPGDHVSAV